MCSLRLKEATKRRAMKDHARAIKSAWLSTRIIIFRRGFDAG